MSGHSRIWKLFIITVLTWITRTFSYRNYPSGTCKSVQISVNFLFCEGCYKAENSCHKICQAAGGAKESRACLQENYDFISSDIIGFCRFKSLPAFPNFLCNSEWWSMPFFGNKDRSSSCMIINSLIAFSTMPQILLPQLPLKILGWYFQFHNLVIFLLP